MSKEQLKILIIEDEEVLLDVLATKLKKEGFLVCTAKDGEQGLLMLKKEKPDLVLLDIIMPKQDGYDVLESIQKDKSLKNIPVIIISNSGQPVEIDRALSLGAIDYLIKAQFEPEEVIQKVHNALNSLMPKNHKTVENPKKSDDIAAPTVNIPKNNKKSKQKNINILIVEDDQFLRELITRKLTHEGFLVTTAIDGKEGHDAIVNKKPNLVLLDIILPIQDGFEILNLVRNNKNKKVSTIPIILLSNLGQESDVIKGKKLGANDYLIKSSLTTDQIVEKIKKYL